MKVLLIETSTEASCIGLIQKGKSLLFPLSGGPELSKNLGSNVQKILETHDFEPEEIVAGNGPGSFTGTRVGLALARSLAFGLRIPIREVCSLDLFCPEERPFAILLDFRSTGIYAKIEDAPPQLFSPEEILGKIEDLPLFSPHPERIMQRLRRKCLPVKMLSPLIESICLR